MWCEVGVLDLRHSSNLPWKLQISNSRVIQLQSWRIRGYYYAFRITVKLENVRAWSFMMIKRSKKTTNITRSGKQELKTQPRKANFSKLKPRNNQLLHVDQQVETGVCKEFNLSSHFLTPLFVNWTNLVVLFLDCEESESEGRERES